MAMIPSTDNRMEVHPTGRLRKTFVQQVDDSTLGVVTVNPLIGHYHPAKGWVAMSSVLDVCTVLVDVNTGHLYCLSS